jgi:hypothetical protein
MFVSIASEVLERYYHFRDYASLFVAIVKKMDLTTGLAIASLVVGILQMIASCLAPITTSLIGGAFIWFIHKLHSDVEDPV